jgi:hypothetical protein
MSQKTKKVNVNLWISSFAVLVGVGGILSIVFSQYFTDWPLVGSISSAVKLSWDAKNGINRFLMVSTYLSLIYLGSVAIDSIMSRLRLVSEVRKIIGKTKPVRRD